jgi:integrase
MPLLKHLLPALGTKLLCDITPRDINDYQRMRLQAGAQGRTVNIEVAMLRRLLKAGDLWQPLVGTVKMLHERHDVAKALTPEQERALLAATSKADSACHTATVLALNTAMRKDEIRLLRWDQVDFEKRTLTVGRSKTEAGTGRLIPLNTVAFKVVVLWWSLSECWIRTTAVSEQTPSVWLLRLLPHRFLRWVCTKLCTKSWTARQTENPSY